MPSSRDPSDDSGDRLGSLNERLAHLRSALSGDRTTPPPPSPEEHERRRDRVKSIAHLVFSTLDRQMLRLFVHELARLEAERVRNEKSSP